MSKKSYDRAIGIDVGNGLIKVRATCKGGRPYIRRLPSVYAVHENMGDALDERQLDLDVYEINGQEFVWGEEIIKVEDLISLHGYENRYQTIPYRNMVSMVLARAYEDLEISSKEKVLIVTGVPSSETGTRAEEEIKNAFTNDGLVHSVKINGEQVLIKLEKEDIMTMSQPVATVIGRYLDEDGTVNDAKYEDIKVAVIDVGGGTTDLDIIKNLRRLKESTSIDKGFRDVYDAIRKDIKRSYPTAQPNDFDLLERIIECKKDGVFTYRPNLRAEPHDFTDALKNAINQLTAQIQITITSIWKSHSDIDEILLVGGSASLFKKGIYKVLDGVEVPKNNGDSNAEGYYRYGEYKIKKTKESVS